MLLVTPTQPVVREAPEIAELQKLGLAISLWPEADFPQCLPIPCAEPGPPWFGYILSGIVCDNIQSANLGPFDGKSC